jgi:hypothetical protein
MSRRPRIGRYQCSHPGCAEVYRYEIMDRAHALSVDRTHGGGQYKCIRHSRPDEVLSADNMKRSVDWTNDQKEHGRYWASASGFVSGPGFKVFSEDWPAGTILRVTAEIITPIPEQEGASEALGEPKASEPLSPNAREEALEPCPRCGVVPRLCHDHHAVDGDRYWTICECKTDWKLPLAEAIAASNRRALLSTSSGE